MKPVPTVLGNNLSIGSVVLLGSMPVAGVIAFQWKTNCVEM